MTHHLITMAEADSGGYLTVNEVHARGYLEKSTINNYLDQGRFTRYKIKTGSIFLALSEIEAWEAKRRKK